MTANRDIPFAKSLIDYIFCWLGCKFLPGYAEINTPNRTPMVAAPESKNITTARQLVEKTKDLAEKIAEAKAGTKAKSKQKADVLDSEAKHLSKQASSPLKGRLTSLADRIGTQRNLL